MTAVLASLGSETVCLNPFDGTNLGSFTPAQTAPRGLALVGGAAGDWILGSQRKEAAIYVWRWGQKSPHAKCRLAEVVGPVVVDANEAYCYAGGASGTLYAWELWTGNLVRVWQGHHKGVACLGLTDDGSFLVSAGDDAIVSAWNLSLVVSRGDRTFGAQEEPVREFHSWNDHTLPVSDMHVGAGGIRGRVFTVSLDRTFRVLELFSQQLLLSISLDVYLTAVTVHPDETWAFVGQGDGHIARLALDATAEAPEGKDDKLLGHTQAVTAVACIKHGTELVSASEDGTLRIWDLVTQRNLVLGGQEPT